MSLGIGHGSETERCRPGKTVPWDRRPFRLVRLLVAVLAFGGLDATNAAFGQHDDFIYCKATGTDTSYDATHYYTYYFTGVFVGDYRLKSTYQQDFRDFLKRNNPQLHYYDNPIYCFFARTEEQAEAQLRGELQEQTTIRVVRTKWTPQVARNQTDSFDTRPIGDFHIAVTSSPYDVQVCVRDHECEDGDRVRASVNGRALFSGEIANGWSCQAVSLQHGSHDIELYAVNGTGFKGECSHEDANTGELRVTGADSQTRSWRHRGGKGSSANIVVTVR